MIKHVEELDAVLMSFAPVGVDGIYIRLSATDECIYTNLNGEGNLITVEGVSQEKLDGIANLPTVQSRRTRVRLTVEEIVE